jgi:hypothetical protein
MRCSVRSFWCSHVSQRSEAGTEYLVNGTRQVPRPRIGVIFRRQSGEGPGHCPGASVELGTLERPFHQMIDENSNPQNSKQQPQSQIERNPSHHSSPVLGRSTPCGRRTCITTQHCLGSFPRRAVEIDLQGRPGSARLGALTVLIACT